MKKILIVFGTRPEAIKMAPLVREFKKDTAHFTTGVCVTAQHREMLDQVLDFFEIKPDYDLNLMQPGQTLYSLTAGIITGMKAVLDDFGPDYVFVHGDTTTSTFAALAAFYSQIKVCHVEAGLRTHNKWAPFPEEMNRQLTGRLADFHFAPTHTAHQNLLSENVNDENIEVTGNTVIDALLFGSERLNNYKNPEIEALEAALDNKKRLILVTGHRRENYGDAFVRICEALKEIAQIHPEVELVYSVHLNPNVQKPIYEMLSGIDNIKLIRPAGYPAFVWLMKRSYFVLTDSGGIQEEAPSLGKPVLVMRDQTERPEAVEAGSVMMVGTSKQKIVKQVNLLLGDAVKYNAMSEKRSPYGDGKAAGRIVEFIRKIEAQ